MTTRRTSPLAMIALTAVAAMLSTAGAASACSTAAQAPAAARGCCATRVQTACGCCSPSRSIAPNTSTASIGVEVRTAVLTPAVPTSSCECRADEPAAPSDRPQAPKPVESTDAPFATSSSRTSAVTAVAVSTRSSDPDPSPRPLYMRTSRLLI
ncbi:hypothetical protein [Paludisphaera mucosa]|uniref:Secreted protein n=1 Tax=Paludisphaera mucosa TaxID=3030827 RepID=A0ABT6FJK6_9BACT|nr:hypothetical protein [Paludisphaera mucosa]MDG3007767.1 hypothetical protein [Paludisphaera mucosa]